MTGAWLKVLRAQVAARLYTRDFMGEKGRVCFGCDREVDDAICWCGEEHHDYFQSGHTFVPMGCNCLRHTQPPSTIGRVVWRLNISALEGEAVGTKR